MNCSSQFDSQTNYTVTSTSTTNDGCTTVLNINSAAACPIEPHRTKTDKHPKVKLPKVFLIVMAVIGSIIFLCACMVACFACIKHRRERCVQKKQCRKSPQQQQPQQQQQMKKLQPQPVVPHRQQYQPVQAQQPRSPQPPITPPPAPRQMPLYPQVPQQQQQQQFQQFQQPQMRPQQMPPQQMPQQFQHPMVYPNLYNGGNFVPLVPMMVQPQAQAPPQSMHQSNPFLVPMTNTVLARDAQVAEDERLARMLQAQFNGNINA
jgi:hypothetical protein